MEINKVNLNQKFDSFSTHWDPKVLATLNGQMVKIAKLKGDFIWHKHDNEDELFYVVEGILKIELRDKTLVLNAGEFVVIPRGVEHKPVADQEVKIILFEPAQTLNTGNITNAMTKSQLENI